MARRNELLYALNAGGVDKQALSRIDLEKMRLAGEHPVTNWLPRVLGPMSVRPGLQHMDALSQAHRMVEFVRDSETTALLLFGDETVLVYGSDGQPVQVANASTAITNPTFASGGGGWTDVSDTGDGTDGVATLSVGGVVELIATKYRSAAIQQSVSVSGGDQATAHTLRVTVTRGPVFFRVGSSSGGEDIVGEIRLLTGTHKLTFTPGVATIYVRFRSEDPVARYVSDCRFEHTALGGAGDLTLPTPWDASRLDYLAWDQSADVLFIGDGTVQPRRIERRGTASWSIVYYETRNGPLESPATDKVALSGGAVVANGTLTASIPYFKPSHVGGLFELTHDLDYVQEELNGINQATDHVTVRGLFSSTVSFNDRNLGITLDFTTGSFVGTVALERSTDSDAAVWAQVRTYTSDQSLTWNDEASNLIAHYRWRVTAYTSGYLIATFSYAAGTTTGLVRVTSYTSSTSVGYEVVKRLSSTGATRNWRGPAWSDDLGWPRVPQFRDDRLHWFRGGRDYASIVDDYDNYDDSVEGDSAPIVRSVGAGADEGVRWALDMDRFVVGTSGFVATIQASDYNEVVTPTSFTVRIGPTLGASFVPPVQIDDIALTADKTGTRLYDVTVPEGAAKVKSSDVSRLNPSAVAAGIVDMAVQRQPDTRVYIVLNDGTCAVLTYERDDKVVAFTTLETDGTIEDVAVLPGADQDDVFFIVLRSGVRYLERLGNEAEQQAVATCATLDAYVVQTGSVTAIAATHLANRTVHVFADGRYRGTFALNGSGAAALGATYSRVVSGLGYDLEFLSVKLAYAAQLGTAVGVTKQVRRAGLVLSNSVLDGLRVGKDGSSTEPMPAFVAGVARTAGQFFSHYDDESMSIPGSWDADSRVFIGADSEYGPVTVQALVIDIETREGIDAPRRDG